MTLHLPLNKNNKNQMGKPGAAAALHGAQLPGIKLLVKTLPKLLCQLENGARNFGSRRALALLITWTHQGRSIKWHLSGHHLAWEMGQGGSPSAVRVAPTPSSCKTVTWGGFRSLRLSFPSLPFKLVCTKPAAIVTEFCFISVAVSNFRIIVC